MTDTWICLGEVDEFHQFCPFATRDKAKADAHDKYPGHWCLQHDGKYPLGTMHQRSLDDERDA